MELWDTLGQVFREQKEKIASLDVIDADTIPLDEDMSLEVGRWYRIRNVVSLYIDRFDTNPLGTVSLDFAQDLLLDILTF